MTTEQNLERPAALSVGIIMSGWLGAIMAAFNQANGIINHMMGHGTLQSNGANPQYFLGLQYRFNNAFIMPHRPSYDFV